MIKNSAKIMYNYITQQHKNLYYFEKLGYNFYYYYLVLREFFFRKASIPHFVYLTNSQCTLKCKYCHTFMPYFKKNMHFTANLESFKTEIDKLLKHVDIIPSFRLQGGETLLVKDLAKMLEYVCSKKQIHHIQIISNGTIIPSEELLKAMKNKKVILCLSDYSNNKDLTNKLKYAEIIEICKKNNVDCKYWINDDDSTWFATPIIDDKKIFDLKAAIQNRKYCYCHCFPQETIYNNGSLYVCTAQMYFNKIFDNFNNPLNDYIDVKNTPDELLNKLILDFMNTKVHLICSKCNTAENKDIKLPPAEQLNN